MSRINGDKARSAKARTKRNRRRINMRAVRKGSPAASAAKPQPKPR